MKKLVLSMVLVNLLAACSSSKAPAPAPEQPKPQPKAEAAPAPVAPAAEATTQAAPKAEATAKVLLPNDPAYPLAKRSVHFPFDVDALQDNDRLIIEENGAFLSSHPDVKARVEGNADERGSSEYNLALGQRRANNTKKALVLTGSKATQIETISYGEEKPMATGHDEESWAQNRRADINYQH